MTREAAGKEIVAVFALSSVAASAHLFLRQGGSSLPQLSQCGSTNRPQWLILS